MKLNMRSAIQKINRFILDVLFPVYCLSCHQGKIWLCESCEQKISRLSNQTCPYCEKEITACGQICSNCKKKFLTKGEVRSLDSLLVCAIYKEASLPKLVHAFKYAFVEDLHIPLGKIMIETILKNNFPLPDLIIPVPLHLRRLRWRGFNQSELLANHIGQNLTPGMEIPVFSNLLIRKKYTSPQMKIKNYQERQTNIRDSFAVNENIYALSNKTILLVDDICTTGSTLFECAKVLKRYGAKEINGIVLARQEIKNPH